MTQALLDRVDAEIAIYATASPELRLLHQKACRHGELILGGVVAGREQEEELLANLLMGEHAGILRVDQRLQEIVTHFAARASSLDEIVVEFHHHGVGGFELG